MKKYMLILLIVISIPNISVAGDNSCLGISLVQIRKQVPVPPAKIVSMRPVNGICEVILNLSGQYVPVYVGKNFVIAGEMFKNRQQITQARIDSLKADKFVGLIPEINQCVAMTVRPKAKPKHIVYMITDPVCPFCHQAETRLEGFAKTHQTEFKILLYSVHAPVGTKKAIEACCRNLTPSEYLAGKWKQDNKTDQYQCQKGQTLINETENLVGKLGVNSVPSFFLADGQLIVGADMNAIAKAIEKKPTKKDSNHEQIRTSCNCE